MIISPFGEYDEQTGQGFEEVRAKSRFIAGVGEVLPYCAYVRRLDELLDRVCQSDGEQAVYTEGRPFGGTGAFVVTP